MFRVSIDWQNTCNNNQGTTDPPSGIRSRKRNSRDRLDASPAGGSAGFGVAFGAGGAPRKTAWPKV